MTFREKSRKWWPAKILPELFLFIGIFIWLIIFDVLSKYYAYINMGPGTGFSGSYVAIPGLFNFTFVTNNGAAWNILADQKWLLCMLSLVIGLAMMFVLIFYFNKLPRAIRIALLLATAGAFGNLVDRIGYWGQLGIYKYGVIDFIQFAFWTSFPVFNLADSYLVIGIAIAIVYGIYYVIRYELMAKKDTDENGDSNEDLVNSLRQKEAENSAPESVPEISEEEPHNEENISPSEEENERQEDPAD